MALLSDLVSALAEVEGIEESFVAGVARYLREAGLVSQAGRGRGAAKMGSRDAAALLIAVNSTVLAKDAPDTLRQLAQFRWRDDREDMFGGDLQAVADSSDELFNWIMDRKTPLSPARSDFIQFMERLVYSAVPLSSQSSRLSDTVGNSDEVTFELHFHRPQRSVAFQYSYYWENPDNVGDVERGIFEIGAFVSLDDTPSEFRDRRERVIITQKTILEVGRVLAS